MRICLLLSNTLPTSFCASTSPTSQVLSHVCMKHYEHRITFCILRFTLQAFLGWMPLFWSGWPWCKPSVSITVSPNLLYGGFVSQHWLLTVNLHHIGLAACCGWVNPLTVCHVTSYPPCKFLFTWTIYSCGLFFAAIRMCVHHQLCTSLTCINMSTCPG